MSAEQINTYLAILSTVVLMSLAFVILRYLDRKGSKQPDQAVIDAFTGAVDQSLQKLAKDTKHYVAVNAVLALTEQFTDDPELIPRLVQYSDQVVAAAMLYRINSLGEQYRMIMKHLEGARSDQTKYGKSYEGNVRRLEQLEADVSSQLSAAQAIIREHFTVIPGDKQP